MKVPVISGASAVTALGRDLAATRAALAEGRTAIAPVRDPQTPASSPAARIGPFTTEPEFPKAKARRLDRGSLYAIVAAKQCLKGAGYEMAGREERTGILLGTGSAGAGPLTEFERQMAAESPDLASPFLFPYTIANAPASVVAIELGIKGPNVTICQKDPSALNALFYGRILLADGRADALLIGAADEWNLVYHEAYERARVTRTATRAGHALGEGAGLVLVEDADAARARGARPLARVAGLVLRTSAVSPHRRRAEPAVLAAAMRDALAEAGVAPDEVDLVHVAANGVPVTDAAEKAALRLVFDRDVPTAAVKAGLGENPAIGAVQLALAAAAFGDDPAPRAVVVNGIGAGGNFLTAVLTPA